MKQLHYMVSLTAQEYHLLLHCMMEFRNKIIRQDGPTEDIDGLILKLVGKKRR